MKNINKNIAVVEYGGSHTECMHLQIKALKDRGYNVFLICNKSLVDQFYDLNIFSGILLLNDANKNVTKKERFKDVCSVRKFTRNNNINSIVFNTLENKLVRNLLILPLPKVKNYIGIIHYSYYINNSGTFKWLYRRVKKIFVLSDNVLNKIECLPRPLHISSFYPIYYPHYTDTKITKPDDEFWFCVPGVSGPRLYQKDIYSILNVVEKTKLASNIKIILLGNIDGNVLQEIKDMKGVNNFITFEDRVPQNIFDSYLRNTDVVLPLIHPKVLNHFYGTSRISGTYNLAYGYRKPMLLEESVQQSNNDFSGISMAYTLDNIIERMNEISTRPQEYCQALSSIENHPYLNIDKQCEKFIELIEKTLP